MSKRSKTQCKSKCKIKGVEPTDKRITGRGGLSLFLNYLENIQIFESMLLPMILPFVRSCNVIYTNLGHGGLVDEQLKKAKADWLLSPESVIRCYHDRGRSELTFRSFKDFGNEQLPFKKFKHNAAFYHCMVLAFNLYESFKEDVCSDVVPVASYPETLRRKVIDIGAKLIKRSRNFILKIPQAIFDSLDFKTLWARSSNPPRFVLL